MKNTVILGASGFVGNELINMCINHPEINIVGLSANTSAGEKINFNQIKKQSTIELHYQKIDEIDFSNVDFVFNCLPNEQLHKTVKEFPSKIRVIDLSIDFRLHKEQDYLDWYNFKHESPELVDNFIYGLTELNRSQIINAKHVANPGCYATSVLIPLTILTQEQAIRTDSIIIDSKSGYSGAGKNFEKKFNYKIINPKPLKKNFKVVSSSLIRKYLSQGKVGLANKCLNRNWAIQGIVESGRKMGKKIGFPTCNISLRNYVIPMLGVYKVRVFIGKNKKALKGIANLGYRPTFNQKKILLEVNIFNFSGNLYNKKLTVEFVNFIREEKKFRSIDQLREQIQRDIKKAN